MGNTLLSYTRLPLRFFVIVFQIWENLMLIAIQGVEFSGTIQYTDWTKTCGKRSGPTVEKVSLDKSQKLIIKIVVLLALTNIGYFPDTGCNGQKTTPCLLLPCPLVPLRWDNKRT